MNYLAENAVYLSWFTGPIAIDTGSKTHTITVNTDGDIEVHQLVHSTGVVTTTELNATFQANDHAPCSLVERSDGKLIAFYTEVATGTGIKYRISTNADDSTAWGTEQTLGSAVHSYAKAIRLSAEGTGSGRIYVFTRTPTGTKRQQYYYSDDDGATWSSVVDLGRAIVSTDLSYAVFSSNGTDRIDIFWSIVNSGSPNNREDVYHCYFQDQETFLSDGTSIATAASGFPMTVENDCTKVYDTATNDEAWVWDCVTDGDQPAVVFATFPNRSTDHDYYWAKYDSTNDDWNDLYKVVDAGGLIASPTSGENHYSSGVCFDGDDPDALYCSIGTYEDGNRIVRMTRSGSTWSEDFTVAGTIGRRVRNIRPVVPYTTGTVSRRCRVMWVHGGKYDYQDDYDTDVRYMGDAVAMEAAGWSHHITHTIAASQIVGSADVNGLMLALITHDNLTSANATTFWANVKNGGGDIRVSVSASDVGGGEYDAVQVLPCDVYYCDTSTEKLKMRVCLPEAVVGATITIWFGNASASARTTLTGHGSDGFPGSHATYSPRVHVFVPDFTAASGNIGDRTSGGKTLTVRGTPDYQQTDYWGGPGAMYFTGADNDSAYADEVIGRCALGYLTPDLDATTENAEMWWWFQGNRTVGGRYTYARIADTAAPHDVDTGASGATGGATASEAEAFSGFAQHHAVMNINGGADRSYQVNDRTEVTAAQGTLGALSTTCINGLRTPSDIPRGKGTYHDIIVFPVVNGAPFLHTDARDTYWKNAESPDTFWTEGTVVEMGDTVSAAPKKRRFMMGTIGRGMG